MTRNNNLGAALYALFTSLVIITSIPSAMNLPIA